MQTAFLNTNAGKKITSWWGLAVRPRLRKEFSSRVAPGRHIRRTQELTAWSVVEHPEKIDFIPLKSNLFVCIYSFEGEFFITALYVGDFLLQEIDNEGPKWWKVKLAEYVAITKMRDVSKGIGVQAIQGRAEGTLKIFNKNDVKAALTTNWMTKYNGTETKSITKSARGESPGHSWIAVLLRHHNLTYGPGTVHEVHHRIHHLSAG